MNIPPDKQGLINDADIEVLKKWKQLRDDIFSKNFAENARIISSNGIRMNALTDKNYNTWWTTKGADTSAVIELQLNQPTTFNVLMLQENISVGQRIEKFDVEYWNGTSWQKVTEGTTVGYKRLLQFPKITTGKVRIKILSSRLNPTLSELGLFYQKEKE